jgi:hypothetical protein
LAPDLLIIKPSLMTVQVSSDLSYSYGIV